MMPSELVVEPMVGGPSLEDAIAAVAQLEDPAILENPDAATGQRRFTILACQPLETLVVGHGGSDPFKLLQTRLTRQSFTAASKPSREADCDRHTPEIPFCGGWIGYFAYEAGRYVEKLPSLAACDISLPVARWGLYDSAAIHDSLSNRWTIVAADMGRAGTTSRSPHEAVVQWKRRLGDVRPWAPLANPSPSQFTENMDYAGYLERVRRAKDYIGAGDVFQVNLARRFTLPQLQHPVHTWLRLRSCNPAPYAAFLSWSGSRFAILSASPELFLHVRGRNVLTKPIKGTRPRSADPIVDASYIQELLASSKDRAELAMIVDLERNDLGRVCEYGSVRVASQYRAQAGEHRHDFAYLESHPTVHHLVASISGTLREDRNVIDLLRATFPGGSITGAPKVRAMEIIDELEPTQRSVYTGAIGHIGLDGCMTLNIAIRTLIVDNGKVHAYVGSGIVADSDPQEEYAETVAKAGGLSRALGVATEPEAHSSRRSVAKTVARVSSIEPGDDDKTCRA